MARTAATLAKIRVLTMQRIRITASGAPPIAKWLKAPVRAVKVIMKTLVPTAVFNSYPKTEVRIKSIIIPPPAPTKPQIQPIIVPQIMDWIILFFGSAAAMVSFVVITGFIMNLIPSSRVMNVEKPPIVLLGIKLAR